MPLEMHSRAPVTCQRQLKIRFWERESVAEFRAAPGGACGKAGV